MRILPSLTDYIPHTADITLTIGNFDGVHLGHQQLLEKMRGSSLMHQGSLALLTFINHPSEIIQPAKKCLTLCTIDHKLKLLAAEGVDDLFLLPFTKAFSLQSAEDLLLEVRKSCPFTHLILGPDAVIGNKRKGNQQVLTYFANQMGFNLHYIEAYEINHIKISSSSIRQFLSEGHLAQVAKLLGRPYSIYATPLSGLGIAKTLGYPTLNFCVEGLCLPPQGVYALKVKQKDLLFDGIANLGIAPTLRKDTTLLLEVHLLSYLPAIESTTPFEIIFIEYLRAEQHFSTTEDLKKQIKEDVDRAKRILSFEKEI